MACDFWGNLVNAECGDSPTPISGDLIVFGYNNGGGGFGDGGFIGLGNSQASNTTPVNVGSDFIDVYGGDTITLALKANGDLYSTGGNLVGALGTGGTNPLYQFTQVGSGYKRIASSHQSSFAIKDNGDCYVAGGNFDGALGMGADAEFHSFTLLGSGYADVVSGTSGSALFLMDNGDVYGTGDNSSGQLGLGATATFTSPTLITTGADAIYMNNRGLNSFIRKGSDIYGSGRNSDYSLGLGHDTQVNTHQLITSNISKVGAGQDFTLFLDTGGNLSGVGNNFSGEMGLPVAQVYTAITAMDSGVSDAEAGFGSSMKVKAGVLYTTGDNAFGAIGLPLLQVYNTFTQAHPSIQSPLFLRGGASNNFAIVAP